MRTAPPALALAALSFSLVWTCPPARAAGAPAGAPAGYVRAGGVLFQMPAGWKQKDQPANNHTLMTLVPINPPAGGAVEIRIGAPRDALAGGNALNELGVEVQALRSHFLDVGIQPPTVNRHRGGFDFACGHVRMRSDVDATQFLYQTVFVATSAGKVYPVYTVSSSAELFQAAARANTALYDSLQLTRLIKFVDGKPPLTRYVVDETTDFMEWMLDVPFTRTQKAALQQFMEKAWRDRDQKEMDGIVQIVNGLPKLLQLDPQTQFANRDRLCAKALPVWRKDAAGGDAMSKMMVEIWEAGHAPIAAGNPPLTRQAADASLEVLFFMAAQITGAGELSPSPDLKDRWATDLARNYGAMEPAARQNISSMPMQWAGLRHAWPSMSELQRTQLRAQWGGNSEVQQIVYAVNKSRGLAFTPPPAAGPGGGDNRSTEQLLRDKANSDAAAAALTNGSTAMFQASMAVAHNMGGGWTYSTRP